MNRLVSRLAVLVGAIIGIVCFFVPWVVARTLESVLPLLSAVGDLFGEGVGDIIGSTGQYTSLTGVQLATELPWVTFWFKVPVVLPLGLGVAALLWLLVAVSTRLRTGRGIDLALGLGCVVAAALLIFGGSSIEHLALNTGLLGAATNALGMRLTTGYWLSLVALLLLTFGFGLGVSTVPAPREDEDTFGD